MPMARYRPEQIVTLLRQTEVDVANGKTTHKPARKPRSPSLSSCRHRAHSRFRYGTKPFIIRSTRDGARILRTWHVCETDDFVLSAAFIAVLETGWVQFAPSH